jgi:hypothetical protein
MFQDKSTAMYVHKNNRFKRVCQATMAVWWGKLVYFTEM